MQVLSMDYYLDRNGDPVTRVWGIGGPCEFITDHRPYFYISFTNKINEKVGLQLLKSKGFNRVEPVKKFEPIGYQTEPKLMFRVYTKSPKDVREARERAAKIPNIFKLYESDVLYHNRVAIDKGLGGFCFTNGETSDIPLKILGFDCEMLVDETYAFPDAKKDPIIIITLSFNQPYDGMKTLVLHNRDEKALLRDFFSILNDYNPDIIAGYNTNEFDIPYINDRCSKLGIKPVVCRDGSSWYIRGSNSGKNEVIIKGRVVVDLLPLIRKGYSLPQYSLREVAKLVNWEKLDVSPAEMRDAWISQDSSKLQQTLEYAERDAALVMLLIEQLKIIDKYAALSKSSGLLLQDVINGGQSGMVEALLMREYYKNNRVINTKPQYNEDEDDQDVKYEGATVINPPKGLVENLIIEDFQSLYPTLIMSHNICYSTLLSEEDAAKLDPSDYETSPTGAKFIKASIQKGILPDILERLFNERIATKKLMKEATGIEKDYLDAHQYGLKILLNSAYGFAGYTRARLFRIEIAESVTSWGRENLEQTRRFIEDEMGYKVVAGDSITGDRFVTVKNPHGYIRVTNIEKLFEIYNKSSPFVKDDVTGKEYAVDGGWQALTHLGWKPIKSVMRHQTDKKIYRVNQKYGESVTTEDHSFMSSDLIETKPLDMDKVKMFKCQVPPVENRVNSIDLWEYVKDFSYNQIYKGREKVSRFSIYNSNYLKFGWQNRKNVILVKRFIKEDDLEQLCVLLGGYITNGSSTFESRLGASICDSNVEWLEKMQVAYNLLFVNAKTCIIESNKKMRAIGDYAPYKDETRKLQMMNSISAAVFTALCGHGAYNKKLPDFAYNLDSRYQKVLLDVLIEGDGDRTKDTRYSEEYRQTNFGYSTVSLELASGMSNLLSILNINHVIRFRCDKHEYSLHTNSRFDDTLNTKITLEEYQGYVYDLTVEGAHTFTDSCGNVLLHNTDSLFVKIEGDKSLDEMKDIGDEISAKVSARLPHPMKLSFETIAKRALFLAKKHYSIYKFDFIKTEWIGSIKSKGLEVVRRDYCKRTSNMLKEVLRLILIEGDVNKAAELAHSTIVKTKQQHTITNLEDIEDLIMTRKYTKDTYKIKPVHVQLIERMVARGEEKPKLGERVPFLIINEYGSNFSESAETPEYAMAHNYTINTDYYCDTQLLLPLERMFECFGVTKDMLVKGIYKSEKVKTKQVTLF